MTIMFFLIFS